LGRCRSAAAAFAEEALDEEAFDDPASRDFDAFVVTGALEAPPGRADRDAVAVRPPGRVEAPWRAA
jgi:hypothetical protein